jgi:hypothetical protein
VLDKPHLDLPFADERERGLALAQLLNACVELERWEELVLDPAGLSLDERHALSDSLDVGDTVESKLRRWASLFGDELRAVLESRNRVVHGVRLGDPELRGAVWLAQGLLGLLHPIGAAQLVSIIDRFTRGEWLRALSRCCER